MFKISIVNQLISSLFFIALLLGCNRSEPERQPKPNILFLFTDDQTFRTIHALGNELINTPNLDKLVNGGTTFTHAYNMGGWHGAVCVASRSMIISGAHLWPALSYDKRWRAGDSTAIAQTWGRIMARNGYDTYMSGKWHVAAPADVVFDTAAHVRPGMPRDNWGKRPEATRDQVTVFGTTDIDLKSFMPAGYHRPNDENDNSWSPTDPQFGGFWEGGKHWSEVLKDDGRYFIETAAQKDDPFFMYLAFNAPHDPRQSPQEFIDQYPVEDMPLFENWQPEYPWKDSIGNGAGLRDEALAPFPRTPYALKKHLQEYYAIITHLDAQVGQILQALEASGKMDNTYIFFTSDHGLAVGQHGLLGKQNMYEHSVRVPLIMVGPDIPKGQTVDADVYLQDIMPTSLELANIPKPTHVAFHSLLDLAKGDQQDSHYPAIYGAYVDLQRMIRKDGFKLIVYPKIRKMLLFDVANDPLEMSDLAANPEYKEKVDSLFKDLVALQKEMEDTLNLEAVFAEE